MALAVPLRYMKLQLIGCQCLTVQRIFFIFLQMVDCVRAVQYTGKQSRLMPIYL